MKNEIRLEPAVAGPSTKEPTPRVREVLIGSGLFRMGSATGATAEGPVREVWLDDYWLDETPVINREFRRFVNATGYVTEAEETDQACGSEPGGFRQIPGLA